MSTKRARHKNSTAALTRAFLYRGIFTRVANRLGKSRSHVRRVAAGERKSRAVLEALMDEILRIERGGLMLTEPILLPDDRIWMPGPDRLPSIVSGTDKGALARELLRVRNQMNLSIRGFARLVGLSRSEISHLELGQRKPRRLTLHRIQRFLQQHTSRGEAA